VVDHLEHAEHLHAVSHHVAIAGLPPPEDAVAIDHEGGSVGDVAILVVHPVGAHGGSVDVAQQREGQSGGPDVGVMGEGAVAADAEDDGPLPREPVGDLAQAAQFGRSDAPPVEAVEGEYDVPPPVLLE